MLESLIALGLFGFTLFIGFTIPNLFSNTDKDDLSYDTDCNLVTRNTLDEDSLEQTTPILRMSATATINMEDPDYQTENQSFDDDDDFCINPANGNLMLHGMGGLDIEGNPYGMDFNMFDHDDLFDNHDMFNDDSY